MVCLLVASCDDSFLRIPLLHAFWIPFFRSTAMDIPKDYCHPGKDCLAPCLWLYPTLESWITLDQWISECLAIRCYHQRHELTFIRNLLPLRTYFMDMIPDFPDFPDFPVGLPLDSGPWLHATWSQSLITGMDVMELFSLFLFISRFFDSLGVGKASFPCWVLVTSSLSSPEFRVRVAGCLAWLCAYPLVLQTDRKVVGWKLSGM